MIAVALSPYGWGLPLLWIAGVILIAEIAAHTHGFARVTAGVLLTVALVILSWEGGLIFVPAAAAIIAFPNPSTRPHRAKLVNR